MSERNTFVRSLHDGGLAAWFGGSLMGAIGVNGAAADVSDPTQRVRVASAGWNRWSPVAAAAIGAHLVGGYELVRANRSRIEGQDGVGANTVVKTVLTGLALAATGYSRVLGTKVDQPDVVADGGTSPSAETPSDVATAQKQLKVLQWVIPALTGAIVVSSALQGEQQRPSEQVAGFRRGSNGKAALGSTAAGGVTETLKAAVTGSGL